MESFPEDFRIYEYSLIKINSSKYITIASLDMNDIEKRKIEFPSWKTAIKRDQLSSPVKWLLDHKKLHLFCNTSILDYGCGRGTDADILMVDKFDPYWFPNPIRKRQYDVVLCTYVLCIIPPSERKSLIGKIMSYVSSRGMAYFSVRRDIKEPNLRKGYTQWPVYLEYPVVEENSSFCIYQSKKVSYKL